MIYIIFFLFWAVILFTTIILSHLIAPQYRTKIFIPLLIAISLTTVPYIVEFSPHSLKIKNNLIYQIFYFLMYSNLTFSSNKFYLDLLNIKAAKIRSFVFISLLIVAVISLTILFTKKEIYPYFLSLNMLLPLLEIIIIIISNSTLKLYKNIRLKPWYQLIDISSYIGLLSSTPFIFLLIYQNFRGFYLPQINLSPFIIELLMYLTFSVPIFIYTIQPFLEIHKNGTKATITYNEIIEDIPERFITQYKISPREADVLNLLITGKTYGTIAEELFISLATVKSHINTIYKKTKSKNKLELVNRILNI